MKNFNLIEMLQGCSKRNGTAVYASNPDGQPTVNRQSRLMSYRGNLKNLAMIFAVLVMSMANIGMAWGTTYHLISGDAVNTTNFMASGGTYTKQSSGVTIGGTKFGHYVLGGTASSASGGYAVNKVIIYNCQTTNTSITIIAYNKNSSSNRSYSVTNIEEGFSGTLSVQHTETISKQDSTHKTLTYTNTTNRTIYIHVAGNAGDMCFLDVEVNETGTALPKAGDAGYALNLNKGRLWAPSSAATTMPYEGLTFYPSSNYQCYGSSTSLAFTKKSTATYFKFTNTSPCKLKVTFTNGLVYNTSQSHTGATALTSATATNDLSAGTYYIMADGSTNSNPAITKIEFLAAAASCDAAPTAPTGLAAGSITASGATFTITDGAGTNNYEIVCKTASGSPAADATPTATGTSTSITVSTLSAGTTYYAWVRAVCDGSHKSSWVALTSSTFTTKAQYTITYDKGANGTGSISAGTKTEGEDFTLSSSVFTRDSYAQTGWATSDGGSKAYDLGGTYSTDAAITLYPVWTATTTYTFDYSNSKSISTLEGEGWTFNSSSTTSMSADGAFVNLVKTFNDNSITTPKSDGSGNDYSLAFAKSTSAYAKFDLGAATTVTSLTGSMKVGTNGSSTAWKSITIKFIGSDGSTVKATYTKDHSTASWTADALSYTTPVADVQYIQIQGANKWQILDELNISYVPTATCPDAYSFHYGPAVGDWETPICFTKVGETNEWNITNFTIPDHTNGEFWVGHHGERNGQSATKAWTDSYSESAGVGNGAMLLLPTNGSVVGNAVGATGTLVVWDNSSSKNQYVGFKPDGYSIRYSGTDHVFTETATANKWETDVVTLPDVSTTYTMEIKTADGYTTCYHSNAPEAISNMGVTNVAGGKKAIYLVPGSFNADGAKYAVYDITNATFDTDFMTDDDGDGIYVGYVGSNCSSMILCRMNSDATTSDLSSKNWDKRWNQTANISISGDLAKKYTITNMTTWNECGYTTANMQPITGQKGKFRMWANSNDNNWYVHFIPYYVLSYDANGGSGSTAQTERSSENSTPTVSVASNGFTAPTGKHFVNWNTAPGGGGTSYAPSDSYSLTADATLYAQWANNQYSVTHSGSNRGVTSGTTGANAATYGTVYTAVFSETTGYNLPATITVTIGGNTTTQGTEYTWDQGTGTVVVDGDYILGDVVITVNGVLKTYTVNFASNNVSYGTVSSSSISSVPHGSTVSINGSTNALTLNGSTIMVSPTTSTAAYTYAFDHWSVDNGDEITGTTTITATFTRTAKTYDVDVTLTDSKATKKSGTTGSNAATFGTNHTLEFEAVSGYELPDDVTVIIGSDEVTKDVAYTWSVSEGVGTLQIGGSYILGNIAITVTATSTCSTPADPDGLAAGSISSSGVTFTITDDESPASYEIYYSTDDDAPEASTVASATTTSKSKDVTGLTANTIYYAWVRAVCDEDYKSDWVALGTSTFKTLATGTKYYLFTPTSAPNPSHTGTLSGAFISPSATSSSETIDTYTFTKNITFGGTLSSISGNKAGDKNITYYNKTSSTKFTLYVKNTNGSQQILYINKIVEGETSVTVANCTIPAYTAKSVEYTYETSDNTTFAFSVGNTALVIYQIVVEEAGTAHKVAGENGYALNLNKGRVACPLSDKADISVNGFLIKAPYNNYKFTNSTELQIEKDKESSTYIKFTTPASPGRLKLTYTGSSGVQMAYNTSASDDGATSITSATAYTLSASTTYYLVNTGTQTAKITKIEFVAPLSGYTVSIAADPAGYGTVSSSSVTSVASGTSLSTSTNTLSVGATDVTATATSASAEYTYAFDEWTLSDGTALPSTVTEDLSVYANFTRTANSYTLTWNTNGGSDLECEGCTSGSTAYGATIVAPTDPTLSNYTFDGWNTANDGSGTAKGSTMPAAATTYYAAWKQTVTLTTGAQGSGGNQTPYVYLNGTSVSDFTPHTASGYTLQGYYTTGSGGTKVLNADGTFAAANVTDYITSSKWSRTGAAPTLYAQWVASEDCRTLKYVWKVTGNFCDDQSTATSTVSMISDNDYFTLSGTGYKQESGKSLNLQNTQNNYFLLTAKTGYQIKSICFYGKVQDSSVDYTTDGSSWSALASTKTDGDKYYTFDDIDASAFGIKLTAATPEGIWIRNMVIEVCAAGGATYNVTYDGNDETSGDEPTDADSPYDYGTTVTVLGNTGDLAKTNYTFAGWTTNDDGTGSSYVEDNTFSITANTTLYAKWTQAVTFDANTANHGSTGGSATAVWNATGLTGITHAKPASGYKLLGYYTAPTSGTKVLNSDGTFASTAVTDYITSGKWSRTGTAPTLYAQYESAGALTWNLIVNSDTANLSTSTKSSAFTEISTTNMTNAALTGLTYSKGKKSSLTGKISTPASYDADKYVYVTFQVASGYKFIPSSIAVKVQPVGENEHKAVELSLADATNTLASSSATKCDGTSSGKTTTVTLAGNGTYFTGTVTLKIYVYPHAEATAASNNCYRLGTPITIEGEIEEACATMPSYTNMSYTTLDYTLGDTPSAISITGGTNINTYTWKQNTTNDRSGGSAVSTGTGYTTASFTPSIASAGTTYYWCEMTNEACGITIKSPAVAVTVSASKSTASVTWDSKAKYSGSDTTAYYGGKNYTIEATLNSGWDGTLTADMFTAPTGIRLHDFTIDNSSNPKTIKATFDVQTTFDIEENDSIDFTLSLPETTTYNALSSEKKVAYNECSGSGEGSSYNIRVRKAYTKVDNKYYWENTDGWISSPNPGSSISSGKAGTTMATVFDSVSSTNAEAVYVRTYHANIKKVRIYADFRANNMTVSNVYKHSDFFTANAKYAVEYTAVYNGDEENENLGTAAQGYVDITLNTVMSANDILLVKFNTSRVRPLGAVITEGSAGGQTTTLAFATTGTVAKTQSSANFTNTASPTGENANSLGAITYSSSNTSCATVNATTGEVTITATGTSNLSTTITATLAASGCFKKATTTYTITVPGVSCTIAAGTLTSDVTSKCSSENATLTLTDFESGATVQWYNGESTISSGATYAITTEGTTSTLVTKEAGTYSVMVTSATCSDRSNSITISNISATASVTKIVDEWYVKNGRLTPDIALWTMSEGATLESVTWDDTNETGLSCYARDGVIYLEGKEPSSNESGADIEYTLTATILDACGGSHEETTKTIKITHQKNTDKHVLAFVVEGTAKGGFTAGITAAQTTDVDLYNTIATNFDVLATNIYSTDDEKKLKEYYSQFDILCITDYPNTKTKGVNSKSYVDAMGALVDIRPILTMEAWVSGLTNWKAKGISGTPSSPTTRQYTMLLQCKDHEIFSGTKLTKVGEGDETMYRISMVCDTLEDYKTLDATYGSGTHESDKNYQYGKKPALQGFTFTKEMLDDELLPLGLIDDGSGNDLQVGIERQTEMEARLMVLGINSYAMERLTDDGQTVVVNALKYLMKKNSEDIADCSNTFVGGAEGDEKNWNNAANWSGNAIPERTQKVRIVAECEIPADVKPHVTGVIIAPSGKYNHGANTANGSLTIAAGGALIVDGKIEAATAPLYTETRATSPEILKIEASSTAQGALIFDNEDGETQATVEMYSPSYWEVVAGKKKKYWSYVGVPIEEVDIPNYFYLGFTYLYDETSGWIKKGDGSVLHPFEGIGLSMQSGHKETFYGTLASTETREITLTKTTSAGNGENLIGNSWIAPIQIANFDASDFGDATATVYVYNTGRDEQASGSQGTTSTADYNSSTPGQWISVPVETAKGGAYDGLKVIPAMNAFQVNTDEETTLTLDYDKLVRKGATSTAVGVLTTPLRAPRRQKVTTALEAMMRVRVSGAKTHTDVWLQQDERFTEAFDNGWEAKYAECDNRSAQFYAQSEIGKMAFLALPDLEGTILGFAPSRDGNEYTFTFHYVGEDEFYLNDLKLKKSTLISEDESYSFLYEDGDTNRFYISRIRIDVPQTPTGVENTHSGTVKARKFIYNDKMYILFNGRVYSADGQMVK